MISGEIVKSLGFENEAEFHALVKKVDCKGTDNFNAFIHWQQKDGTKRGLQNLPILPEYQEPQVWLKMKYSPMYIHQIRGVCFISWVLAKDKNEALKFPFKDASSWILTLKKMSGEDLIAIDCPKK